MYLFAKRFRPIAVFLLACASLGFLSAQKLPPVEADAIKQLNSSPRHGEWQTYDAGGGDKVNAWIVYPERADKAPVVILIHEIFGLTDWVRAVADQFAAEGFIAIAPDFLSGKGPDGKGSAAAGPDGARALIGQLQNAEIVRRLNATSKFGTSLPSAAKQFAVVGFCWGGGISFSYATQQPDLGAAVVYYGTAPAMDSLKNIRAPVLGLFGGSDERVNATVRPAATEMLKLGKSIETFMYEGAGHAFLRQQDGQNGANLLAAKAAWPKTIDFLKKALAAKTSEQLFDRMQIVMPKLAADVAMKLGQDPAAIGQKTTTTDIAVLSPVHQH